MGALKFIVLEPRIVFDASLTGGLGCDLSNARSDTPLDEAYEMMKRSIQSLEPAELEILSRRPDTLTTNEVNSDKDSPGKGI